MGTSIDQKQYGIWLRAVPTKNQPKGDGKEEADHPGKRTESSSSAGSTEISKEKEESSMEKKSRSYQRGSPGNVNHTTDICDPKWNGSSIKGREAIDKGTPESSPKRKERDFCKHQLTGYKDEA
ncbi:hypothetical protein U1Q18_028286, partial [Sarracenia purpurea var. burkii]